VAEVFNKLFICTALRLPSCPKYLEPKKRMRKAKVLS
jgi:hypothetical protein